MFRLVLPLAIFAGGLLILALLTDDAAAKKKAKKGTPKVRPVFAPVRDDPALPRALLIGDSISVGYTLPARTLLKGKVNLHRIPFNGASTKQALGYLDKALGKSKWDVIHFNWGLHDLKHLDASGRLTDPKKGRRQVPIEQYEKNLKTLVGKLKAMGARLIWAATTPVPPGAGGRVPGDAARYNAVAAKVMKANDVAINDLHALVRPKLGAYQLPANVHFQEAGSQAMAEQVAKSILEALKAPTTQPTTAPAEAAGK